MKVFFKIILLHLSALSLAVASPNKVRKTNVAIDELTTIKAAVGIATIIQLPEAVQSVIIGDSGAFKIEYLDKAITIKPLRYGAKTNLYVNTQSRRYNLRLATANQDEADYIVYVQDQVFKAKNNSVLWRDYKRKSQGRELTLSTKRLGRTKDGFLLLDFEIKSKTSQKIDPASFWIYQGEEKRVIQALFISESQSSSEKPVTGSISINMSDLVSQVSGSFEFRGTEKLKIELPREVLWKK